jgi:hypothetical protein
MMTRKSRPARPRQTSLLPENPPRKRRSNRECDKIFFHRDGILGDASRINVFFIIVLSISGLYLAQRIPISVFPDTNFPRVVIGIDNDVMPVDQMQVTITKPIEECSQLRPGPAGRTLEHQPRVGRGKSLLRLERGHVSHAAVGGRRALQSATNVAD